ncbi:carbon starvation CstA family protein [Rhodopirellula europaea]|jgi:carbon starvation protein|uniref:Carbon starvation protein A n=1 Tax=Rhodopirellula europaea SH398 TaxID=1263868 RepID=M5SCC8_9BACT|nr:carbon starvation protein A [Rhodopirellula europaea]EMI29165.1 carbon starvation protein A [Rhodopirellula europaea SH398]
MSTLVIAILSMVAFVVAYHTYGRYLATKLFRLSGDEPMPSVSLRDDVDFVPTNRSIVFGHHFTSIAGTGPIVGPALAVFWGWLPALLWVVFGSILIGGVHDLAALVISIRNRGESIGQAAGRLISPRAKVLFLIVLALALSIVLAVFGLVIANIFKLYPESVLSVWTAMPVAAFIGWAVIRRGGNLVLPCLIGLGILYLTVYLGTTTLPLDLAEVLPADAVYMTPVVVWTLFLLVYAFFASVLPVWLLLQPRDFLNSLQLGVALVLLVAGLAVASLNGQAKLATAAPAIAKQVPADAPPMLPFLFITIACGACSGFHCLVSSGTTSKQLKNARDAQMIGYGSMLGEGMLAVLVILACCAGVGMGRLTRDTSSGSIEITRHEPVAMAEVSAEEAALDGSAAWRSYYRTGRTTTDGSEGAAAAAGGGWKGQGLDKKLAAFIDGGANFISAIGIPLKYGVAIMAVMVACFAATTLDTATRLQRYVISELASSAGWQAGTNKYVATTIAVGIGMAIAVFAGDSPGKGGLMLWPLFGATNQLLAGLALMVAVFYLARRSRPVAVLAIPMGMMLLLPAWAMVFDLVNNWWPQRDYVLIGFGTLVLILQAWMVGEAVSLWRRLPEVMKEAKANGEPTSTDPLATP